MGFAQIKHSFLTECLLPSLPAAVPLFDVRMDIPSPFSVSREEELLKVFFGKNIQSFHTDKHRQTPSNTPNHAHHSHSRDTPEYTLTK